MLVTRYVGLFIREGWVEAILSFTTQLFEKLLNCVFIIYHAITSAHSWRRTNKTQKRQLQFNRSQMNDASLLQVRVNQLTSEKQHHDNFTWSFQMVSSSAERICLEWTTAGAENTSTFGVSPMSNCWVTIQSWRRWIIKCVCVSGFFLSDCDQWYLHLCCVHSECLFVGT